MDAGNITGTSGTPTPKVVYSTREVLPRTFSHKFGDSPTAQMKFIVSLDKPTPHSSVISACGYPMGTPHPEYPFLAALGHSVTEPDYRHAEVTIDFGIPPQDMLDGNKDIAVSPLARKDVWEYSTSMATVPTWVQYPVQWDNVKVLPIVNTAGDPIQGLTTQIGEMKVSISGNRSGFPLADAIAATGAINHGNWLGGAPRTWQCTGISGKPESEDVNGVIWHFWKITVELTFRRQGFMLNCWNTGMNVWEDVPDPSSSSGGTVKKKIRAYTTVVEGGIEQRVPTAEPVALNADGSMRVPSKESDGSGTPPDPLSFRVHPELDFSTLFGAPW